MQTKKKERYQNPNFVNFFLLTCCSVNLLVADAAAAASYSPSIED